MKTDFLIVGSGLYGSVFAERIANKLNKKVLIIEKRDHIGGNCHSEIDPETGIEFHKYGTHIFHTNNQEVINYINNFTSFNSYKHQVLTSHKNKIFQMPINLETINNFYDRNYTPYQAKKFIEKISKQNEINKAKNFEEKAISSIGKDLYEAFIKNYTIKQWKKDPKDLPSTIFNRLPIRYNYNEDYFHNCKLEGIPLHGYGKLFENLLSNKNIKIEKNKDYFDNIDTYKVKYKTIYTGPIDKFFNYKFGKLEWRSLKFKRYVKKYSDFQGTSVMNYADYPPLYTRIHEPKHLHPERKVFSSEKTLIIKEFPYENNEDPYYPINNTKNTIISKKYKELSYKLKNFILGGRLADYAYYDMDMTISAALKKFNKLYKDLK